MKCNYKGLFLVATIVLLLCSITALSATDDISDATVIKDDTGMSTVSVSKDVSDNKNMKKDVTTHVVNNDNVEEIFSGKNYSLSDSVKDGDNLDFQGTIDKNHSIVINKQVNAYSSTKDAVISLHTVAGTLLGEDPGNSFRLDPGASGSTIRELYINNTQTWIFNVHDVNLTNMSLVVKDARVGSGVGQTAVRYSTNVVLDNCFIYTENNGGSSSFVWTGSSNCTLQNSHIEGQNGAGSVGNLVYIGNPYNYDDKPADFVMEAVGNKVLNCTIITPNGGGICIPIQNLATESLIEGNRVSGAGSTVSSGTRGILRNNDLCLGVGISISSYGVATNNTVHGNGSTTISANSVVIDNTFYKATLSGANITFTNNTAKDLTTISQPINLENNKLNAITLSANSKNSNISNNEINGAIAVNAANITIKNNLINTTNETAVVVTTEGVVVANNTIYAATKVGNSAVNTTKSSTKIEGNEPSSDSFVITDENYSDYFTSEGLVKNVDQLKYAIITLQGTFNDKSFILTQTPVTINGDNAVINNGQIVVNDTAKAIINNITFVNTNLDSSVVFNTDNNVLRNSKIRKTFTDSYAREVYITGDNNRVEYNSIEITGPSRLTNFSEIPSISPVSGIAVLSSSNVVQYNNVTYTDTDINMNGSSDLITVSGTLGTAENNLITRNNLKAEGSGFLYGISLGVNSENNNLTYNTFNITSSYYSYGVNILKVPMMNNAILYNTMNLKSDNTAYGVLANVWGEPEATDFRINNNNINVESESAYGVQLAGSPYQNIIFKNVNLTTNTINVNGKYAMGIGLFMTENVYLYRNTITVVGETNETNPYSYDYVQARTAGVYSGNSNITKLSTETKYNVTNGPNVIFNNVKDSQITGGAFTSDNTNFVFEDTTNSTITTTKANTTTKVAVQLTNSDNNTITNNEFRGDDIGGDDAVVSDEESTENVIDYNVPMITHLTDDNYSELFDENSVYTNTNYTTILLDSDLYNKDLKFTNTANIVNTGNYTIYNGTIYYMDTEDGTYKFSDNNITGVNFNNVNKAVIVDQLTNEQERSIYFYYGNITIVGDDVVVFDSQKDVATDVYIDAEYNNITVDATNVAVAKMIRPVNENLSDYIDLENNNIKITATEDATIIDAVGSSVWFESNDIDVTAGKDALIVSNLDGKANNYFYAYNNINATGDNVTALILINNSGNYPSLGYNTFNLTSTNPIKAVYSENCENVFVGLGRTSSLNRPNEFYINVDNGEVPVIELLGKNNSVRKNTIITEGYVGDAAVVAEVIGNNTPKAAKVKLTPVDVIIGSNVQVVANVTGSDGKAITSGVVEFTDGDGMFLGQVDVTNGQAVLDLGKIDIEVNNTVDAQFLGNDAYAKSRIDTTDLIVRKSDREITLDPITITGDTTTFTAQVTSSDGVVNDGKVCFRINGKILRDENNKVIYAYVTDGVATLEDVAVDDSWNNNTTIEAVYTSNSKTEKATSEKINMVVIPEEEPQEPTLEVDDVAASAGEEITIKVDVKNVDDLNSGKVVLKVNGKTVKSDDGKLYAKVVDGSATFTYKVPVTAQPGEYAIKATYTNGATKLDATSTLTISEVNLPD